MTLEQIKKVNPNVFAALQDEVIAERAKQTMPLLLIRHIFFSNNDVRNNFSQVFPATRIRFVKLVAKIMCGTEHMFELNKLDYQFIYACCEAITAPDEFLEREQYIIWWMSNDTAFDEDDGEHTAHVLYYVADELLREVDEETKLGLDFGKGKQKVEDKEEKDGMEALEAEGLEEAVKPLQGKAKSAYEETMSAFGGMTLGEKKAVGGFASGKMTGADGEVIKGLMNKMKRGASRKEEEMDIDD